MNEEEKKDWQKFTRIFAVAYLFIVLMVFIKTTTNFNADNFAEDFFVSLYRQTFNWLTSVLVIYLFHFKKEIYNYLVFFILNTACDLFVENRFISLASTIDYLLVGTSLLCLIAAVLLLYFIPTIVDKTLKSGKDGKLVKRTFWTCIIVHSVFMLVGGGINYYLILRHG